MRQVIKLGGLFSDQCGKENHTLFLPAVVLFVRSVEASTACSSHGVNYSETGCTIMAIVSAEDLATLIPG